MKLELDEQEMVRAIQKYVAGKVASSDPSEFEVTLHLRARRGPYATIERVRVPTLTEVVTQGGA